VACSRFRSFNPVKHGHAARVQDWPYSTFRRMVRDDVYPLDWAGDSRDGGGCFGERP
jgi:putative transposase